MRVTVPTEVAIVLARFRTFAMLMDDDTSEVALALLVLASFLVDDD
ncbi:MAG: hypothetical protein F6K42_20425 [Leptolyngbya sp. SIO1D8]|nr:hypothetical protein [Leptolyngbya sp. SIO1D8]